MYQNKVGTLNKWYARACYTDTVDLDGLAEHMANHNTPYSAGAIKGVLTDMVNCIKELLLEGKKVKLPDLAIFCAGFRSTPAETAKAFSVQQNIRAITLKARGTGKLNTKNLDLNATVREAGEYKPE